MSPFLFLVYFYISLRAAPKLLDTEVQPPVVNASYLSSHQEDKDDNDFGEDGDTEFTSEEQKVGFDMIMFVLSDE